MSLKNLAEKKDPITQAKYEVPAILKKLMHQINITEAEFARQTGLPQATINRILLGGTTDPRASTLTTIAKFFDVTIEQLLGEKPIHRRYGAYNASLEKARAIPVVTWKDIVRWEEVKETLSPSNHANWIVIDREIEGNCLAAISARSMEPRFPTGSILILDTNKKYKDGCYVVVLIDKAEPAIRRIYKKGNVTLLVGQDESAPPYPASVSDIIVGTIIETRINMD